MDNDNNNVQKKVGNNMKELSLDDLDVVSGGLGSDAAEQNRVKMENSDWYSNKD